MLNQAREFLHSLDNTLQQQLLLPFADSERKNWNYKPAPRRGVPLRRLSPRQQAAAMALLEAALSAQGAAKAKGIMQLEGILGDLEGRSPEDQTRDPEGYFLTLYGELTPDKPWGWRIDGHHLSLTFTALEQRFTTMTPAFFGANPAEVPHGPRQGWRVLQQEEALARKLLGELAASQRQEAIIATAAPADILSGTSCDLQLDAPAGLPAGEMTADQRQLFKELLHQYTDNFNTQLSADQRRRIFAAGIERLHFAWAGGQQPGEGHYYRIQGPALLIEYDNTQNNANHIHSVMRDPERDFGGDLLRRHYQEFSH